MTQTTAYSALPHIAIAGSEDRDLAANIIAMIVEETSDGLYRCEITLSNFGPNRSRMDYLYLDRQKLDFGTALAISFGPPRADVKIFEGRISALEASYSLGGTSTLTVLAEDRLQDLRMTRRTRSFEQMSDSDILRRIAGEHSLTPQIQLDGPTHAVVAQVNQSDLAFIRDRARACDTEVWVEGSTLHAARRSDRAAGNVRLAYGVGLIEFTVRADLAHQRSEVGVSGWDVAGKTAISEVAARSEISSELGGDTGGSQILEQAFAPRRERVVHTVPLTSSEARAIAQVRYRERARRFVCGHGFAEGDPRIRVGCTAELSGLGAMFDGRYYVVRACHSFDLDQGFKTEFDVERAGIGS
ncbi:phage late control D family protein [Chloroflexia bacterium SDU3-3]|nr:phage late control D family protein [Chloroflexia bacterium SDU3-3]